MILDELIALETQVWSALQRGDADADASLLAADFLGVYPSGFSDRSGHAGQLVDGPTVAQFTILDARAVSLSPDHALLAYRADYRRIGADEFEEMYVSSIWSRRDGDWINVFSQDTPVDSEAKLP